ncbi:bifunctional riboflavin kinase/FAD synthetase [Bacillus sp. AK128]
MEIINVALKPPIDSTPLVLVIGKFDGIHKGHQLLLQTAKEYVNDQEVLAVWSFNRQPKLILNNDQEYEKNLTPENEKLFILHQLGVKRYYNVEFTKDYSKITSQEFIQDHLSRLNIKRIVVGEDFYFGKGREAGVTRLIELCQPIGVSVTVVPLLKENGEKINSTKIRSFIREGKVERALSLLGRTYQIKGTVIHGKALGRKLGFPTANLGEVDSYVLPKPGLYLGSVDILEDGYIKESWSALINAGYRPTVNGEDYLIEAYLLHFNGNLYGKTVAVSFNQYMRDEIEFQGVELLVEQMERDRSEANVLLGF